MLFVYCIVLVVTIACRANADDVPVRVYTLRKDYFNGINAAAFSVMDISKKTIYYRIESKFTLMPKFELIAHPSKEIVGKLKSRIESIDLSLLDDKTGQWMTGTMKSHLESLKHYEYTLLFNGRRISMVKELLSSHTTFRDESQDGLLLARFQREFFSPITATTYGVQIYSNSIPDGLYLLALAWTDIDRSESYPTLKRRIRHAHA